MVNTKNLLSKCFSTVKKSSYVVIIITPFILMGMFGFSVYDNGHPFSDDDIIHQGEDVLVYDEVKNIDAMDNIYDNTIVIESSEISDDDKNKIEESISDGFVPVDDVESLLGVTNDNSVKYIDKENDRVYVFSVSNSLYESSAVGVFFIGLIVFLLSTIASGLILVNVYIEF